MNESNLSGIKHLGKKLGLEISLCGNVHSESLIQKVGSCDYVHACRRLPPPPARNIEFYPPLSCVAPSATYLYNENAFLKKYRVYRDLFYIFCSFRNQKFLYRDDTRISSDLLTDKIYYIKYYFFFIRVSIEERDKYI